MKAMITGVAGFIGSHLAERLLAMGWDIVGIDVFDDFYDPTIKRRNLRSCVAHEAFQLHEIDIRHAQDIRQCTTDDIDVIIHLAARAGVRPSIARPELYADVNVNGTLVLLETARQKNIKRFIFASSSSVYGNNTKVPFSEDDNVDFPISPYAATKKAGELLCHTYHHLYGLDITCLRFFTVYGPRQRPDLAVHKFTRLIEADEPVPIYGDGTMMRDLTYIEDIINGLVASIEACQGYHLYNLGASQPIRVNNLVTALEKALGKQAQRHYVTEQPGDVKLTFADVSKAAHDLGYAPHTSLAEGLAAFVRWFQQISR